MHPREKAIKAQIALGTFNHKSICGADMLAIEDIRTVFAICDLKFNHRGEAENGHRAMYVNAWLISSKRPHAERMLDIKRYEIIVMGDTALRTKEKEGVR